MKWQAALAGALASALVTCMTGAAFADVRIVGDPGGEVASYIHKFNEIRASGERVVIDGPCLSACTLFTGIVPRDHVCVTRRAALGVHAASYYDDASRSLVPEATSKLDPSQRATLYGIYNGAAFAKIADCLHESPCNDDENAGQAACYKAVESKLLWTP